MNLDFNAALDECLRQLRAGVELQTCLARYPQYARQLRPLLELAADLYAVAPPSPSPVARAAGRHRMLDAFEKRAAQPVSKSALSRYAEQIIAFLKGKESKDMKLAWKFTTVAIVAVLALTSVATVAASTGTLPGDALYPVKLTVQKARVALTFDATAREQLAEQFDTQQRQEIQTVLQTGQQAGVEFQGVLQQIATDAWIVGGLPVTLQPETIVEGQPRLGAQVSVSGRLPGDGSLVATRLTVGETAPGAFDSPLPTPSVTVSPTGTSEPTQTPALTGTPELTETPEPTETLEPTETHEADETEEPDDTRTPELTETPEADESETPELTRTPEPTETHEAEETEEPDDDETSQPTGTPRPTETLAPPRTSEPTETVEPTRTPEPTRTEEPTETPEPDETDEPDETPEPTETPDD